MNHYHQPNAQSSRPSAVVPAPVAVQAHDARICARSKELQRPQGMLSKVACTVLQSAEERKARRVVAEKMTLQAEAMLKNKLAHDTDNIRLEQEIRTQRQMDLQLIQQRHAMHALGQTGEHDLNEACTALFVDKKRLLESAARKNGDESLGMLGIVALREIANKAVDDLQQLNRHPG